MKKRKLIITTTMLLFFFSGCGYSLYFVHVDPEKGSRASIKKVGISEKSREISPQYYPADISLNAVILTHADLEKKKVYIQNSYDALMDFHLVAFDSQNRGDISGIKELGREANSYIKNYVEPILNDTEVIENLETKAEVAKLYLMTTYLYYELGGYYQAEYYLKQLSGRIENNFLWGITTEGMDTGFHTVGEGVACLQKRISVKLMSETADNYR